MQEFSVLGIDRHRMRTDGRGITSLVGLAGCPLCCSYCINAELLKAKSRIEKMTPEALVERLSIDHCYFLYSNGGVTFGGGEPLLHSSQIAAFAGMCPKEWNITIETSLNVPTERLEPLLNERFSYIIDIKAMQPEIYLRYTGQENEQVIRNQQRILECIPREQYLVKVPLIPEYSNRADAEESKLLLQELGIPAENIVIFPYVVNRTV